MSCLETVNKRFTITKGIENTFDFIIKSDGNTTPIEVAATDSVTAIFKDLETGETLLSKSLTVGANLEGRVTLVLTEPEVELFKPLRGSRADRFYLKPVYSLILDSDTAANGKFIAKVDWVYVD